MFNGKWRIARLDNIHNCIFKRNETQSKGIRCENSNLMLEELLQQRECKRTVEYVSNMQSAGSYKCVVVVAEISKEIQFNQIKAEKKWSTHSQKLTESIAPRIITTLNNRYLLNKATMYSVAVSVFIIKTRGVLLTVKGGGERRAKHGNRSV